MILAVTSETEQRALLDAVGGLSGLEDGAPPLLEAAPYTGLEAKGALAEARVAFEQVPTFIRELAAADDSRFTHLRVLLLDGKLDPVGSIGLRRGNPPAWRHFTHGGAKPLVAGLKRVSEVEERTGARIEVRLLVVTDLLCESLILLPEPPAQNGPAFLCLSPRHRGPDPNHPLTAEGYLAHLADLRRRLAR